MQELVDSNAKDKKNRGITEHKKAEKTDRDKFDNHNNCTENTSKTTKKILIQKQWNVTEQKEDLS